MAEPTSKSLIRELAQAVAAGEDVSTWCEKRGVQSATASEWQRRNSFQQRVAELRHHAVDRAVGKMATNLGKAVERIVTLVEEAESQSVQLTASKTLIDKLLLVQNHAELRNELRRLDERLAAQEKRRGIGLSRRSGTGRSA